MRTRVLLGLGEAEFPGDAGVLQGGQGAGAGAAVVAGDEDDIAVGLGDAGGHGAEADLGHELHADPRPGVGVLEVVDELGEVFDRVDVVVRRRADEGDSGGGEADLGDPGPDLVAGQLPPLAGLGPLGHLDLDLVGIDQIVAGDAEAAGGDLLDRAALAVAVGHRRETLGVLAPLAGVAAAAEAVHGDGEGLVGLGADGAVGHGAGGEALDDGLDRLDLVDRHRRQEAAAKVEEAAEGAVALILLVDLLGVGLEDVVAAGLGGVLEAEDRLGVEEVIFPLAAPLISAAPVQDGGPDLAVGVGAGVVVEGLAGDLLQADTADPGGGLVEVLGDQVFAQADSLENLGAAVAGDRADAHLGHHLDDPLLDRLAVLLDGGVVVDPLLHHPLLDHVVQGLEGDVGVDGPGAVAEQEGEVVVLAGVAALHDQPGAGPQALAHEVVVEARAGQERGDRCVLGVDAAVGEDQEVGAVGDGGHGHVEDEVQGLLQPGGSLGGGEGHRQDGGLEASPAFQQLQAGRLVVVEDRRVERDEVRGGGDRVQQVPFAAGDGEDGSHKFLADGVERGVGDLGE